MNMAEIRTELDNLLTLVENALAVETSPSSQPEGGLPVVTVKDNARLRATIHRLAEVSALETGPRKGLAQFLIRQSAQALGIIPASIHALYQARGRGEVPCTFTVPAINLRAMTYVAARSVFRLAHTMEAGAFIFELSRSEVDYTRQRPAEYAASIMAAAIAEGFTGPLFLQADHCQVDQSAPDMAAEITALKALLHEFIAAGFYNLDLDTSTLVDYSQADVAAQQAASARLTVELLDFVRTAEPEGVTISVGGEIGEWWADTHSRHNSREPELHAYLDAVKAGFARRRAGASALCKIAIQTGVVRGGVLLPDGSIARVDLDFDLMTRLSRVARRDYQIGGIVQHGASTLPETAFGKFVEAEALEVHLATNFQNILFDRLPADLRLEAYDWLCSARAADRQPGMTDEQFYYETRKHALGAFKDRLWALPHDKRTEIFNAWNDQFRKLFVFLGMRGTRLYVEKYVQPLLVQPDLAFYTSSQA